MPEGDTIWRIAERLGPVLVGNELRRFEAARLTGLRPRPGRAIAGVEAVGKHLLIHFGDGITLETHLRMTGSWHLYGSGQRWRQPRHLARAIIEVDGWTAVCFAAPIVRTFATATTRTGRAPIDHLGPDLTAPDIDLVAAARRFAATAELDVAVCDHLLDQRAVAGIGNVYKNELLWSRRLHPLTAMADVSSADREALVRQAATWLRLNTERPGNRVTAPMVRGGLAVYGRANQPCPRCASRIVTAQLGRTPRVTFWCPTCQRPAATAEPTPL